MKFNFIFSLLVIFISVMLIGCGANPSSNDNINDDSTVTVKPLSNDNISEDATATVTLDVPIFAAPSGYIQGTSDEFNSSSLSSIWQANYLKHRTTDAASAARYSFSNGILILRIDRDTPVYNSSIDSNMKVSSIQTGEKTNLHKTGIRSVSTFEGFKQQYGYFEVRAMHQKGSGNHVAFWCIGTGAAGTTQTGEIDITEDPGTDVRKTKIGNLVPWGDSSLKPQDSGVQFDIGNDLTTNYNVYGMEWQSNSLKFYVNGSMKRSFSRAPAYPMYFFLGLYEGSNWTGTIDTSIPYPKTYKVDYFRTYHK